MARSSNNTPVALSIAGSDSGAGAGVQADLLTFAALGVFGTTALTCVTAQNPDSVTAVESLPAEFVLEQILQVNRFFSPGAIKTGMLFNRPIIDAVSDFFKTCPDIPKVIDPVMVATSGATLLRDDAIAALQDRLLPRATLVTPNSDEAGVLLGRTPRDAEESREGARILAQRFGTSFLLKGGHLPGASLVDILAHPDGTHHEFTGARIAGIDTHGSGCTLSAAIAAQLALGANLETAVARARDYVVESMSRGVLVGGRRFIGHLSTAP